MVQILSFSLEYLGMDLRTKTFSVSNIHYAASVDTITKKISHLDGVNRCEVNSSTNTMFVEYDHDFINSKDIILAVKECGYEAWLPNREELEEQLIKPKKKLPLLLSLIASVIAFVFLFVPVNKWMLWIPAIITIGMSFRVLQSTIHDVLARKPKTDCINVIAGCLSFVCAFFVKNPSYFLLATCFILTECIATQYSIEKNRMKYAQTLEKEIRKKMPKEASVYQNHKEERNALHSLQKDQVLLIRPGETVPADGRVTRGFALLDVSALTGYDSPIEKSEGSYVYANSICLKGSIELKAERVGNGTAMMRFAEIAERTAGDTSFSSPFQKFTKWLLLYILLTAFIALIGWFVVEENWDSALLIFLSVLSCASLPSLSIVTKNRIMKAARSAAEKHILFRTTEALELVGKTDILVMDQDGSLTESDLIVTDFIPVGDMREGKLEYIAYALENRSDVPFAKAITRYLKTKKLSAMDMKEFSQLSSHGKNSIRTMNRYFCGTKEEVLDRGIDLSENLMEINELSYQGKRVLLITEDDKLVGIIAAVRPLIPGAKEAMKFFHHEDMDVHVFADGTQDETRILARRFKVTNMIENPTNDEKDRVLKNLSDSDNIVTYISSKDSSLRLQNADVTVSIGAGAKFEEDHAGIILTRNRLSDFVEAVNISSDVNESIQQSQIFVILYHAIAIITLSFFLPQVLPIPYITLVSTLSSYGCLLCAVKDTK